MISKLLDLTLIKQNKARLFDTVGVVKRAFLAALLQQDHIQPRTTIIPKASIMIPAIKCNLLMFLSFHSAVFSTLVYPA